MSKASQAKGATIKKSQSRQNKLQKHVEKNVTFKSIPSKNLTLKTIENNKFVPPKLDEKADSHRGSRYTTVSTQTEEESLNSLGKILKASEEISAYLYSEPCDIPTNLKAASSVLLALSQMCIDCDIQDDEEDVIQEVLKRVQEISDAQEKCRKILASSEFEDFLKKCLSTTSNVWENNCDNISYCEFLELVLECDKKATDCFKEILETEGVQFTKYDDIMKKPNFCEQIQELVDSVIVHNKIQTEQVQKQNNIKLKNDLSELEMQIEKMCEEKKELKSKHTQELQEKYNTFKTKLRSLENQLLFCQEKKCIAEEEKTKLQHTLTMERENIIRLEDDSKKLNKFLRETREKLKKSEELCYKISSRGKTFTDKTCSAKPNMSDATCQSNFDDHDGNGNFSSERLDHQNDTRNDKLKPPAQFKRSVTPRNNQQVGMNHPNVINGNNNSIHIYQIVPDHSVTNIDFQRQTQRRSSSHLLIATKSSIESRRLQNLPSGRQRHETMDRSDSKMGRESALSFANSETGDEC